MKKYFFTLFAFALPAWGIAQVQHADSFNIGDVLNYMVCTPPDSPANTGVSVIWDFSSVQDSGNGQRTTWILDDTASTDPNDIMQSPTMTITNTGSKVHKTTTQSFLTGTPGAPAYTYDLGILLIDRTLTYGLMDSNAFSSSLSIATNTLTGAGTSKITVDGSGTLKTPMGTFNNVLRVKRVVDNIDSIPNNTLRNLQVTYLWYDGAHTAPLFRVDSLYRTGTGFLVNATQTTGTSQYLQAIFPVSVKNTAAHGADIMAHLDNNGLVLNAALVQGKQYSLAIFNTLGQAVYSTNFDAISGTMHFSLNRQLATGTYVITIVSKNDDPIVLKTTKE